MFYYYNGSNLVGFENDPQGGVDSEPCAAVTWRKGESAWEWVPYADLSLYMTVAWSGDYDFVPLGKLEAIQKLVEAEG